MRKQILALASALLLFPALVLADTRDKITALAPSGLVFVVDDNGTELLARNADEAFSPASVAKIVTAWLAMEVLGGDYRFETRFYLDDDRVLYVRGGGDPFLVSEELELLAGELIKSAGVAPFTRMVIDTGYYPDDLRIPGIESDGESYNAPNSALAVNFNTINAVRRGKTVRSAEKQTPITPLAIAQFRTRGPNGKGRISFPQEDPTLGPTYAGELLAAFIAKAGGSVEGKISIGSVPQGLKPVYVHRQSRDLAEIAGLMLLGSNNFIANQIFLEVGARQLGGPVSLKKSRQVAGELLGQRDLAGAITLVEGSGISPDNKFTARGLAGLLRHFAPHAGLLRKSRAGSRYKTGTIPGVRTLAGYAATSKHGTVRFVISLGGRTGKLRFRLLREIERGF